MLEQKYKFANYDEDEDFPDGGEIPAEDDEESDA